jgi:uncharacterized protein YoxC
LSGQLLLFAALSVAALVLAVALAVTLLRLRKTIELLERRLDESLRQFEMTAEDLRKTSGVLREILIHAERSAANVEHVTEGVRAFRSTLDAASSVMSHVAIPVLGNVAGVLAGAKAAVSHVVNRFGPKEGKT